MQATHSLLEKSEIQSTAIHPTNLNLPNLLTCSRIVLIPIFIVLFSPPSPSRSLAAVVVFGIAAITDFFDGYLARKYSQVTTLGKLLDPVADKLLVTAGLMVLVQHQQIDAWFAFAIIAREISVTGLRTVAATAGMIIPADTLGKFKTFFQICGIMFLSLPTFSIYKTLDVHHIGSITLYISLAFGLLSGFRYLSAVLPKLGVGVTAQKKM